MEALNIAAKVAQVLSAGFNAAATLAEEQPTTQDKANVVAQLVFACVQIGDLATPGDSSARMWTSGTAGFLDVVRTGTSLVAKHKRRGDRWTWVEIAQEILLMSGTAVFRAGDVARIVEGLSNNAEASETCDVVISVADGAGAAVSICFSGVRLYISFPEIKRLCRRYQAQKRVKKEKLEAVAMHVIKEYPSIAGSLQIQLSTEAFQKDEEARKNEGEIEADMTYLLINKDSPEKIAYIPQTFASESWNICCITCKPIRFVIGPNFPEEERDGDNLDILYEKETLEKWLDDHANDKALPPKWPSNIPFTRNNFRVDKFRQRDTNRRLKDLINELVGMGCQIQPVNDYGEQ